VIVGKPLVIIESPFSGATEREMEKNISYAQDCLAHSIAQGEAPFASHLLYPQVLEDDTPAERRLGMTLGWEWMALADRVAVYCDRGISQGMKDGMDEARALRIPIEKRWLLARA
jgi:hypothetical protein